MQDVIFKADFVPCVLRTTIDHYSASNAHQLAHIVVKTGFHPITELTLAAASDITHLRAGLGHKIDGSGLLVDWKGFDMHGQVFRIIFRYGVG